MSGFSIAKDYFDNNTEFAKLIAEAGKHAETDWQINFVTSIEDAFVKYGMKMRLSEKQYNQLIDIAGW